MPCNKKKKKKNRIHNIFLLVVTTRILVNNLIKCLKNKTFKSSCKLVIVGRREYSVECPRYFQKVLSKLIKLTLYVTS